jgi:peroxin-16
MIERPSLSMILSEKGVQGALFLMGEVLFITRPLIYVLLIRKYGIRSWIPWFLSLAVDTIGAGFLTQVTKSRDYHLTASEQDEVRVLQNFTVFQSIVVRMIVSALNFSFLFVNVILIN